jgi:glutamate/tyrosine decarboxylase-like PLP-dependent enzyme
MGIPAKGRSADEVLRALADLRRKDESVVKGPDLALAFTPRRGPAELAARACSVRLWDNALDPTLSPSVLRLEMDIVGMLAAELGGDAQTRGNFTSGGTESVMLAVKTARDWGRARKPGAGRLQIILPVTAHPCFHKGAAYCDMETIVVPIDPRTFRADVGAMRAALTERTVLVVGSAPGFPQGVVDPIEEIAALAREAGILCHVDACVGGLILSLYRRLGHDVPPFDFRVPGVTSLSVDLHKYGLAPLGASVVLFKDPEIRKHELFVCTSWPGYTLVNPTIQSSRSAGPLAGAWALLHHLGLEGYLEIARTLREATLRFVAAAEAIPGLRVLGQPAAPCVAVASEEIDPFRLGDEMRRRGWPMFPQMSCANVPRTLHAFITLQNALRIDEWIAALREAAAAARTAKPAADVAVLRQALDGVDLDAVPDAQILEFLAMIGLGAGELPGDEMAEVYGLLDELPTRVRDRVVGLYYAELSRPRGGADQGSDQGPGKVP